MRIKQMAKTELPIISKLSEKQAESFIPCGIEELDEILGSGFPVGRITEISGNEAVGKTHLVTKLMANLSDKHRVLFCDTEFSLNKDRVAALGANPAHIAYVADSRLEQMAELIINNIGQYDVIILDSIASLIPLTIETQEVGESTNIGLYARLIKQFVMKMRPQLGKSKTAFIAINQMRKPIGAYVRTELPGGAAWAHVCDIRLRLTTNSSDKIMSKGIQQGHVVHAECTKNKISAPFIKTSFRLTY